MSTLISPTMPAGSATLWTSSDLLARCKMYARRPAVDESMSDAQWYALLTEANAEWTAQIANVAPESQYAIQGPVLMTSADGGYSYTFGIDGDGNQITPIGRYEIRQYPTGREFIAGAEWDPTADFVDEGWRIRFPNQYARSYGNGPWARFVAPGGTISAVVQPALQPQHINMLLVWRALAKWAKFGGVKNPGPFEEEESKAWYGDPTRGMHGWLTMLQTRAFSQGAESLPGVRGYWWRRVDSGSGYTPYGI
jgi:hypothetical protein